MKTQQFSTVVPNQASVTPFIDQLNRAGAQLLSTIPIVQQDRKEMQYRVGYRAPEAIEFQEQS